MVRLTAGRTLTSVFVFRGVSPWLLWHAGIQHLFDSLIDAIIQKKDKIEQENEMKRRDSVLLSSTSTPVWAAQADQEEAREKARAASSGSGWSCCST